MLKKITLTRTPDSMGLPAKKPTLPKGHGDRGETEVNNSRKNPRPPRRLRDVAGWGVGDRLTVRRMGPRSATGSLGPARESHHPDSKRGSPIGISTGKRGMAAGKNKSFLRGTATGRSGEDSESVIRKKPRRKRGLVERNRPLPRQDRQRGGLGEPKVS